MSTGTVKTTEQTFSSMKRLKFEWTSTTGGSVGYTTTESYSGLVYKVIIAPSTSTGYEPSTGYDVAINDSDDYDILNGLGTNSSTSTVYYGISTGGTAYSPITAVSSKLTLAVSDAGDTKSGEVVVYIR
ncbi:hypothetical protein ES705_36579 [subsurface metagenome]